MTDTTVTTPDFKVGDYVQRRSGSLGNMDGNGNHAKAFRFRRTTALE